MSTRATIPRRVWLGEHRQRGSMEDREHGSLYVTQSPDARRETARATPYNQEHPRRRIVLSASHTLSDRRAQFPIIFSAAPTADESRLEPASRC